MYSFEENTSVGSDLSAENLRYFEIALLLTGPHSIEDFVLNIKKTFCDSEDEFH